MVRQSGRKRPPDENHVRPLHRSLKATIPDAEKCFQVFRLSGSLPRRRNPRRIMHQEDAGLEDDQDTYVESSGIQPDPGDELLERVPPRDPDYPLQPPPHSTAPPSEVHMGQHEDAPTPKIANTPAFGNPLGVIGDSEWDNVDLPLVDLENFLFPDGVPDVMTVPYTTPLPLGEQDECTNARPVSSASTPALYFGESPSTCDSPAVSTPYDAGAANGVKSPAVGYASDAHSADPSYQLTGYYLGPGDSARPFNAYPQLQQEHGFHPYPTADIGHGLSSTAPLSAALQSPPWDGGPGPPLNASPPGLYDPVDQLAQLAGANYPNNGWPNTIQTHITGEVDEMRRWAAPYEAAPPMMPSSTFFDPAEYAGADFVYKM